MRGFWFFLNTLLLLMLLALGGVSYLLLKGFEASDLTSAGMREAEAASQQKTIDLPGSISFRVKGNALCQDEAVLVEGGESFRFTLRPVIDLPAETPIEVRTYVETRPDLEERTKVEWKSNGNTLIKPSGSGRYEFSPPKEGGNFILSFRGSLRITTGKGTTANLSGKTDLRLICPIRWEDVPPRTQKLIGHYPISKNYKEFYKRPDYWYRVTEENKNWKISPHFALGDFDLHFDYTTPESPEINQYPQYVALNPHLVLKLEGIIDGLSERGVKIDTLGILAGYRSPGYNHWKKEQGGAGGKYTKGLSSHMYGAAADFYVDQDGDGVMDDMNGDGRIDQGDAFWIRDEIVDAIDCQAIGDKSGLAGGCGTYGEHDVPDRSPQTPNLHVDVRGYSFPRWIINSHDQMATQYSHWDKHPCPHIPKSTPSPKKTSEKEAPAPNEENGE